MKLEKKNLPRLASWIIKNLLPGYLGHMALGDYEELYERMVEQESVGKARIWLWRQIFSSVLFSFYWAFVMLNNYIKVAFRNMCRHKGFSFINIAGLAVGMTCAMLILLWVQDELSYDRFHKDAENIYRVAREVQQPGQTFHTIYTSAELCRVLREEFPEIVNASAINGRPRVLFTHGDKAFYEEGLVQVDTSFFDILSFPFIAGHPQTALLDVDAIVITEDIAKKYFGDENPLGKTLTWNNWLDRRVTGVIKNIPQNSHVRFDMVINTELMKNSWPEGLKWEYKIFRTYVKLQKGVDPEQLGNKVIEAIDNKYPQHSQFKDRIYFQPLTKAYLHAVGGGGSIKYVYIFSLIAFFVLFIACINYMNLATARSVSRVKEVGLRKVVGSNRQQLAKQFLGESLFFVLLSYILSIVLIKLFLPAFNQIAGKQLVISFVDSRFIFGSLILVFFTGLVAGSYPAFYLSSFPAVEVLKGHSLSGLKGAAFRRILVVTQFSLSVGLIICTAVVHQQLDFLRNKELGFDKENIVSIPMKENIGKNYQAIKNRLLQNPSIISVTAKDRLPTRPFDIGMIDWEGKEIAQNLEVELPWIDYEYFETMNMEIIEGRDFSRAFSSDIKKAVIVNEEALKRMNLKSPLGKRITFQSDRSGFIIGVVKNAHFRSRQDEAVPEVYRLIPDYNTGDLNLFGVIFIKLRGGDIEEGMAAVEDMWKEVNPNYPFEYHFLDAELDDFYGGEMKMKTLSDYFSLLAILISCLGLFGLASFMAERRTKEIGVRKVLGASGGHIMRLLSGEFVKWIVIANLIAWPAAYLVLRTWLDNYAYRIKMEWWVFLLSGMLAMAIAMLTVSYQALKTARTDPVKALRYE
jgi:predicted permease